MTLRAIAMLLGCLLGLSACAETVTKTYPLSGRPCSPDDPVHGLGVAHFTMPF